MSLILGIGAIVVLIIAVVSFVLSRIQVVNQTHAMLVSGSQVGSDGATKVVKPGGRAFIFPIIQKADLVPLGQMNVALSVTGVDKNKIPIEINGVAMVKVRQEDQSIRSAFERFGSAENGFEEEIIRNLQQVLTGSLRSAISEMSVEELLIKREVLAKNVKDATDSEVSIMGIVVDSLQVLEINDKNGYIIALGAAESEKVKADARVAKALNAQRARDSEVTSEQAIAERDRDLELRRSQLQAEQDKARATAAAAGPLEKAEQDRSIAQIEQQTAKERAALREQELDAEIRKPADARRYSTEQDAEASKKAAVLNAESDAAKVKLLGQANAESILEVGSAEAEAMSKKADAYKEYGEAAIIEILMNKAPEIAKALAEPMSNIDKLTVISTDGAGALPKTVANNYGQLDQVIGDLTGSSISDLVSRFSNKDSDLSKTLTGNTDNN